MIFTCVGTGSSGNCYFLTDDDDFSDFYAKEGHYLMLDCGEKLKWQDVLCGCNFQISKVDALLVTHQHKDHLPNVKKVHKYGIPVYGSDELYDFVKDTQGELIHCMKEKCQTTVNGGWKVVPWYVPHTGQDSEKVACYAYFVTSPRGYRMVYLTDFLYSPLTFKSLNVQTILIACNHDDITEDISENQNVEKYRHIVTGHSSLSVVKDLILANKTDALKNIILCHLSHENATPDLMQKTIQEVVGDSVNVFIAQNGMEINL